VLSGRAAATVEFTAERNRIPVITGRAGTDVCNATISIGIEMETETAVLIDALAG
jgi:hypothetical protein